MRKYIGNSVYAEFDGSRICLTTQNGYEPSSAIILEPEVMCALIRFFEQSINKEKVEGNLWETLCNP